MRSLPQALCISAPIALSKSIAKADEKGVPRECLLAPSWRALAVIFVGTESFRESGLAAPDCTDRTEVAEPGCPLSEGDDDGR